MALDILVVDDEHDIRELVAGVLEDEGYETPQAADSDAALEAIADATPLAGAARCLAAGLAARRPRTARRDQAARSVMPVLMISGHGNLDTAVAAIRRGRGRFHRKAVRGRRLLLHRRARDRDRAVAPRESQLLRARSVGEDELTGTFERSIAVRATMKRVAGTGSRVLITGPGGRRQGSRRAHAPWLEPAPRRRSSSSPRRG